MDQFPKKLKEKLDTRKAANALRQLNDQQNLVDFSSNDYLGFSKSQIIFDNAHQFLINHNIKQNGATGSRLLSGNHALYNIVENIISEFHNSEAAIVFNSGYDANVGFFSCIPQRNDIIFYDEYIHASIRDGIKLSNAKAYKFKHNHLEALDEMLKRVQHKGNIYIVTESVFSMDGDIPDLATMCNISKKHKAYLVVDEAHAIGVFGERGVGLVQKLNLEKDLFARLVTYGKAMGAHGAAILGSQTLKQYLINFSRSFIYTTALPPHSLATIQAVYNELVISNPNKTSHPNIYKLHQNIQCFKTEIVKQNLQNHFIKSNSAIQCCILSGNQKVKQIAKKLQEHHFNIKPILSPTVTKGEERLRFCLHSYNSEKEIVEVLQLLTTFVTKLY